MLRPLLKDVRVLVVSHCLLSRMFTSWAPQILTVTLSLQDSELQIEPEELLAQIYKLCTSLLNTKVNDHIAAAESISICQVKASNAYLLSLLHFQLENYPLLLLMNYFPYTFRIT